MNWLRYLLVFIFSFSIGTYFGYREAFLIWDRSGPLLALKFKVNKESIQTEQSQIDLWSLDAAMDESIVRYLNSLGSPLFSSYVLGYNYLNDPQAAMALIEHRINSLRIIPNPSLGELEKLDFLIKGRKRLHRNNGK